MIMEKVAFRQPFFMGKLSGKANKKLLLLCIHFSDER